MAPEFICPNETVVMENTVLNTIVTTIKAIDKDEGRNSYLEYSLVDLSATTALSSSTAASSSSSYDGAGTFALGSADGLLRLVGKLDRELKSNYTLRIRAKDRGEPPKQTEMSLLVKVADDNDNRPIFNPKQYSAFVPENVSIGVAVLQVNCYT